MTGLVLQFDADLAPHVVRALSEHLRWLRANRLEPPAGLIEALEWARVVQGGLSAPNRLTSVHDDDVEPLTLSLREAADLVGVSLSTIKRAVADGRLPVVLIGSVRRVRRVDVEALVAGADVGSSFRDRVVGKAAPLDPAPRGRLDGAASRESFPNRAAVGSTIRHSEESRPA